MTGNNQKKATNQKDSTFSLPSSFIPPSEQFLPLCSPLFSSSGFHHSSISSTHRSRASLFLPWLPPCTIWLFCFAFSVESKTQESTPSCLRLWLCLICDFPEFHSSFSFFPERKRKSKISQDNSQYVQHTKVFIWLTPSLTCPSRRSKMVITCTWDSTNM